jgi:hypothetical protein
MGGGTTASSNTAGPCPGGAAPVFGFCAVNAGSGASSGGGSTGSGISSGNGSSGNSAFSSSGTNGGCTQWNVSGTWQLQQSNGYSATWSLQQSGTQINGMLTLSPTDQAKGNYVSNTATVQGTLNGNALVLTSSAIAKHDGSASQARYTGTVVQGQIVNGLAQDLLHPGSSATFTANGPEVCKP